MSSFNLKKFAQRLKLQREKLKMSEDKWTQEYVSKQIGVARSTYTAYENGTKQPPLETVEKLATLLKLSYNYLLGRTDDEKNYISYPSNVLPYNPNEMVKIPILGSIKAGDPIDRVEFIEGYTLVDPSVLRGREGFALKVKGDSMNGDRIQEGDIVICVKQEEASPREIAVVAVDAEFATLKRVKCENDMCILFPSNPQYQPILVPAKDTKIIGVVVQIQINC